MVFEGQAQVPGSSAVARYDLVIVGGGIVGLATGLRLLERYPGLRLAILEKEREVGAHQTGHNSGVIHSGIYYKPGSLKARLCVEGAREMVRFCAENGIAYDLCGKLIVATNDSELPALQELHRRGLLNGVPELRMITRAEMREAEPHAAGVAALLSPKTGIVDYKQVAEAMARKVRGYGAEVLTAAKVVGIHRDGPGLRIETETGEVGTRYLVNCAGLYSDAVARLMGVTPDVQIIPFRGEYYFIRPEKRYLLRNLLYPVPDPQLPFLGVHLTRTIHGDVEAGPNAVMAFAREGYTKKTVRWGELVEMLRFPGLQRLAVRYWKVGLDEYYRSFSRQAFARSLQELVPEIQAGDLMAGGAGVRAQAVSVSGELVDDFRIMTVPSAIHVLNAPSPAATASLSIGSFIVDLAVEAFQLN